MSFQPQRLPWLNPFTSLQARIGMTTAATAILLSTILSLIVGHISRTQLEAQIQRSLFKLAQQVADQLDQGMFERYRDIRSLAALEALQLINYPPLQQRRFLEEQQQSYPAYAWIGITDTQGKVIAATQGNLEGKNVADRPWFQNSIAQSSVGDVHEAKLLAKLIPNPTGEPIRFVDLAAPIQNQQGNFQGVLGAHLSWNWAKDVKTSIETSVANESIEVLILGRDHTVLLGNPALQGQILNINDPSAYKTALAKTQGYRNYPGLGWSVLVRQPTDIALAPARSLQWQVFLYGTGIGLLFALWSWFRSRRIVQPLQQLTTVADQISQGDRQRQMPYLDRQDEIARLAHAFDHMLATLNQQSDQLREQAALLEIATDAIVVRSLDWQVLFWNQSAARMYGWTVAEAMGQNVNELLHQSSIDELQIAEQTLLATGEWCGELEKTTKMGQTITVESRWTLAYDAAGKAQFVLTVDTDITAKKQLEAQFLRAQRLENLGALAGGIAHDMNNILTPIISSAQLLQMKLLDRNASTDRMLNILVDSSRRGADLVQQILSFARGTAGEHMTIQLKHILKEISQILESTFPKNIEIKLDLPKELWVISADSTQLHQVLMNLCVNARDAMPQGGKLRLGVSNCCLQADALSRHPEAQLGNYVMLTIADTGEGMSPEVLDRIFEPFYTTKDISKGTGLGLSTVFGIIKSHGGLIDVQSTIGAGTCFTIYLPAALSPESDSREAHTMLPDGAQEWILLVDDETSILEVTKLSLEAYDYQVMTATNGVEALQTYRKYHAQINVILIDLMMPELDGIETIRVLRAIDSQVKIIATSGLVREETMELEINAFLLKPYTIEQLLRMLHKLLPSPTKTIALNPVAKPSIDHP
jgi:two-component system, cell cycle sensor histidine kinase and response regulator CckA